MQDTFAITILFIFICTLFGAFIKGRSKDRCLNDFSDFPVTLKREDGKIVWGRCRIENSGLELVYDKPHLDADDGHIEKSYILYKAEFGAIRAIARYVDALSSEELKIRDKVLKRTIEPSLYSVFLRKIRNIFGTIRDSIMEVASLLLGRMKTAHPGAKILQGQDKYISQIQQQSISAVGTSYEPILERYIGKKMVLDVKEGDQRKECTGILKDYTIEFIEILDTDFACEEGQLSRKADLIVPRNIGIVRHSG